MKPIPRISPKKYKGLGDIVHAIAQPIARAIDSVARTKIATCGSCASRRRYLNEKIPFSHSPE